MGVIETEYSEIRDITKRILSGAIDKETASLALKAYSESGKRVDQLLKVYSLTINHGKSARQIITKNIISDGTAIDMGLSALSTVHKCPEKGDILIDRIQCLDYSGTHYETCQDCEHFAITRKQLL